jgi:phosphonate transport system ATP-binding protein
MKASTILSIRSADIGFERGEALIEDVNLQLKSGEIVGIIGRSGIGKTTLLRTIAGLVPSLSGELKFMGDDFSQVNKGEIGLIPQRLGLVQHQTVGYNVLMGALPQANFFQSFFSLPSAQMRESTRRAVASVGLADKMLTSVNQLSGGQQRRVAIARAMVQNPKLILADECLGELDVQTARDVIELLRSLAESGSTILIIEHNPVRARTFCDRVLQLRGRKIISLVDEIEEPSGLHLLEGG